VKSHLECFWKGAIGSLGKEEDYLDALQERADISDSVYGLAVLSDAVRAGAMSSI
jgi:hypothetical protein